MVGMLHCNHHRNDHSDDDNQYQHTHHHAPSVGIACPCCPCCLGVLLTPIGSGPAENLAPITLENLAAVLAQGPDEIDISSIEAACASVGVSDVVVADATMLGEFNGTIDWPQFFTVLCGFLPELTLKKSIQFMVRKSHIFGTILKPLT